MNIKLYFNLNPSGEFGPQQSIGKLLAPHPYELKLDSKVDAAWALFFGQLALARHPGDAAPPALDEVWLSSARLNRIRGTPGSHLPEGKKPPKQPFFRRGAFSSLSWPIFWSPNKSARLYKVQDIEIDVDAYAAASGAPGSDAKLLVGADLWRVLVRLTLMKRGGDSWDVEALYDGFHALYKGVAEHVQRDALGEFCIPTGAFDDGSAGVATGDVQPVLGREGSLAPRTRQVTLDQTEHMLDRTIDFFGRSKIRECFDGFMEAAPRGYYFVLGDPGIGKSAFAAKLCLDRETYIHHFNVHAQGITSPKQFLDNIWEQLQRRHPSCFDNEVFRQTPTSSQEFTQALAALKSKVPNTDIVVVVDALDEADLPRAQENRLAFPSILPIGVYILVTHRDQGSLFGPSETVPTDSFTIDAKSEWNKGELGGFLRNKLAESPRLRQVEAFWRTSSASFIGDLLSSSEGNFMYLRCVLPELERGAFVEGELPQGLENYYERQWRRMQGHASAHADTALLWLLNGRDGAFELSSLTKVLGLPGGETGAVLSRWKQFLHIENKAVSFYHRSFADFIGNRNEVDLFTDSGMVGRLKEYLRDDDY